MTVTFLVGGGGRAAALTTTVILLKARLRGAVIEAEDADADDIATRGGRPVGGAFGAAAARRVEAVIRVGLLNGGLRRRGGRL